MKKTVRFFELCVGVVAVGITVVVGMSYLFYARLER